MAPLLKPENRRLVNIFKTILLYLIVRVKITIKDEYWKQGEVHLAQRCNRSSPKVDKQENQS